MRKREQGPRILRSETFAVQATSDATGGPNDSYALAWLYAGPRRMQSGDETTIRASSTVTCVTGSWVLGAMTLEQDLPAGRYAIVGVDCTGATAIAARFSFAGGSYQPGFLIQQAAGQFFLDTFRSNSLGVYGEFENSLPPQLFVLGTSGAVTLTLFLDIIKIG